MAAGAAALAATPAFAQDHLGGIRMPASTTESELRGLSPTGGKTYWASGSKGWIIRGKDERQDAMRIVGAEGLDFRGLHALDDHHVLAMSAGPGGASQLWRTSDGGKTWKRIVVNTDPDGFWDSIAFVDPKRGFILGDPTQGRFTVLYTADGGETWTRLKAEGVPPAAANEGAFAASNGCVAIGRHGQVAFCTGGAGRARVYLSRGGGGVFVALETPILADAASKGAFAVAFAKDGTLWVCGGDYRNPTAPGVNLARLAPGGLTFEAVAAPPGYLSSVAVLGDTVMATGLAGTIASRGGAAFQRVSAAPMNTVRLTSKKTAVLCGPKGAIGLWRAG
ncbi:YCF48-related protein [uncultured Caulobacter sp.]|uniref:WD40/YVTN/BNR-like repeat-containing protein n=1 Tax=uncultured Caulobacter sp. TaxID=158749 RepID=UPI002619F322|nr:YCF48-related protein [uncultured Caulobacter sp.]